MALPNDLRWYLWLRLPFRLTQQVYAGADKQFWQRYLAYYTRTQRLMPKPVAKDWQKFLATPGLSPMQAATKFLFGYGIVGLDAHLVWSWDAGLLFALRNGDIMLAEHYLARNTGILSIDEQTLLHYARHFENSLPLGPMKTRLLQLIAKLNQRNVWYVDPEIGRNWLSSAIEFLKPNLIEILKLQRIDQDFINRYWPVNVSFPDGVISKAQVETARKLIDYLIGQYILRLIPASYVNALDILIGVRDSTLSVPYLAQIAQGLGIVENVEKTRYAAEVFYGSTHSPVYQKNGQLLLDRQRLATQLLTGQAWATTATTAAQEFTNELRVNNPQKRIFLRPKYAAEIPGSSGLPEYILQRTASNGVIFRTPEELEQFYSLIPAGVPCYLWPTATQLLPRMQALANLPVISEPSELNLYLLPTTFQ